MCILFVAIDQHQDYPLIIAANRDEFHHRPTAASHFWPNHPTMLAGKDLQAGGSWMAVNQNGRFAALTNIRNPLHNDPARTSRGQLVTDYVAGYHSSEVYHHQIQRSADQYNGYNLLFGPWDKLNHYNNLNNEWHPLIKGVYGLSNASLNSPWPKLNTGVAVLKEYCQRHSPLDVEALFTLLKDQTQADNVLLPDTGVSKELEKQLSSIFIQGQQYGTRSSTILTVNSKQNLRWQERIFDPQAQIRQEVIFNFKLC
ncbi:NRDE family protein [Neptunicella sp. SCSIO 80796]|uniref:NRDE family protein n=1 Tax=Neptunicella plasticusilytica TaxID=3117012 RepID=UPI003A4DB90F